MGRGRQHMPPPTNEGIWFQHRGTQSAGSLKRQDDTSTGSMLSAPYRTSSATNPAPPPPKYTTKDTKNYRNFNKFSEHDNRNSFQDHGVYFGDGQVTRQLGRNLIEPNMRLHHTQKTYLKHHGRQETDADFHTTYQNTYKGREAQPPQFRRFKKSLPEIPSTGRIPLDTTTSDWFKTYAPEHKTSTQVLAVSQEPFPQHNPWKYSYHSKRNVYPPYERRSEPVIDNTFNRYGAAFNHSSGAMNSTGLTGFSTICS